MVILELFYIVLCSSFSYMFNGFDDFLTTINMWLLLPSMFTHSNTVVLSLAGITTHNRTGNNNHTNSAKQTR
jgi:hypothetical protein